MWPSSPLSSWACLIENSWQAFWAAMWASSQSDSGSPSRSGYLSCTPCLCCKTKAMFLLKLVISQAAKESLTVLSSERAKEKAVALVSITFVDNVLFLLFVFLLFLPTLWFSYANGVKWPNFTSLYCAGMSRCNLTKCCSQSWLYGLSFQTLGYLDFVHIICVCGWLCMCVYMCLLAHEHEFSLKQYFSCILFAQSTKFWHPLLIFLRLSRLASLALTRSSLRWKKKTKQKKQPTEKWIIQNFV